MRASRRETLIPFAIRSQAKDSPIFSAELLAERQAGGQAEAVTEASRSEDDFGDTLQRRQPLSRVPLPMEPAQIIVGQNSFGPQRHIQRSRGMPFCENKLVIGSKPEVAGHKYV